MGKEIGPQVPPAYEHHSWDPKRYIHRRRYAEELVKSIAKRQPEWTKISEGLQEALDTQHSISRSIYYGNVNIRPWFTVIREIHQIHEGIKAFNEEGRRGDKQSIQHKELEKGDIFEKPFRGVSLADIEQMKIDPATGQLAVPDIKRINKMFRDIPIIPALRRVKDPNPRRGVILSAMLRLATQAWLDSDGPPRLHGPLAPVERNLIAYFDYYTSLITDPSLSDKDEGDLFWTLTYAIPWLPYSINTYLPARLGITASSVVKIAKQKKALGDLYGKAGWQLMVKSAEKALDGIYVPGALPPDLEHYQLYNEEIDTKAGKLLESFYEDLVMSDEEQFEFHKEARSYRDTFIRTHHKELIREIRRGMDQRIKLKTDPDHVIEGITVTTQNKHTVMFIAHLSGDTHVTLEMTQDGRLWGIPPRLLKAIPHIEDLLMVDILGALFKKRGIIPEPPKDFVLSSLPDLEIANEEDTEKMADKKRERGKPSLLRLRQEPTPPSPARSALPQRFVSYSEKRVIDLLGTGITSRPKHETVSRLLETIHQFEQGRLKAKTTDAEKGLVRLESDGHFILLRRHGNGAFSLERIFTSIDQSSEQAKKDDSSPEETKAAYTFSFIKHSSESGTKIEALDAEEFASRRAEKIAGNDPRMVADLCVLLESIKNNPYGEGTKLLIGKTVTLNQKTYRLRRLDPRKREELEIQHDITPQLRVVYTIVDESEHRQTIALKGIYTHDEYDKEFGS